MLGFLIWIKLLINNHTEMTTNWMGWLMSIFFLGLLFLSGYIMQNSVRLLIMGKRAQGIVVGMALDKDSTSKPGKVPLQSPLVEFKTADGASIKVSGRSWNLKPSALVGDAVNMAYNPSNPKDAQILLWKEFPIGPSGAILGFATIFLLMWISGILISGDSKLDDPFHLLPMLIAHLKLNPFRFPIFFLLTIVIPVCCWGAYSLTSSAINLKAYGIKTVGQVVSYQEIVSKTNNGSTVSGVFPMITYKDASGKSHTIKRSLAKPLSRLKPGDLVPIIYPANHPEQGHVNTWDEFWPGPIFFGFVSIAFLWLLYLLLTGKIQI